MKTQTERLELRVTKGFLKLLDKWRSKQPDLPSRSQAIRMLVEEGVKK